MAQPTADDHMIGQRIARYRNVAGISQAQLAARVTAELTRLGTGRTINQGHVSKIETGAEPIATRHLWIAFANALGVSVADLLAQPVGPQTPEQLVFYSLAPAIRRTLLDEFDPQPADVPSLAALTNSVLAIEAAQMATDWEKLTDLLPPTLAYAAIASGDSEDMARLFVRALVRATIVCHLAGHVDLATLCGERAVAVARGLGDPEYQAGAAFASAQAILSAGAPRLSFSTAAAGAEQLQTGHGSDLARHGLAGMLHMHAALAAAASGRTQLAWDHMQEAGELAVDPRDSWGLEFGEGNHGVWTLSVACEATDWGSALTKAQQLDPGMLHSPDRLARLWIDTGRARHGAGDWDGTIVAFGNALGASARITRVSPHVREITRDLGRQVGRGSEGLLRLVAAVGLTPNE